MERNKTSTWVMISRNDGIEPSVLITMVRTNGSLDLVRGLLRVRSVSSGESRKRYLLNTSVIPWWGSSKGFERSVCGGILQQLLECKLYILYKNQKRQEKLIVYSGEAWYDANGKSSLPGTVYAVAEKERRGFPWGRKNCRQSKLPMMAEFGQNYSVFNKQKEWLKWK